MVRSLVIAGASQFDELGPALKSLEMPFESCVKDLRSQVMNAGLRVLLKQFKSIY